MDSTKLTQSITGLSHSGFYVDDLDRTIEFYTKVFGWEFQVEPQYGYGMASVRFICGTQTVHTELEAELSSFLGTEKPFLSTRHKTSSGTKPEPIALRK